MKKSTKIALILVIIGVLVSSISYFGGARTYFNYNFGMRHNMYNSNNYYSGPTERKDYNYSNLQSITIDGSVAEVKLIGRNVNTWEVYTVSPIDKNNKISVSESNGNLTVNLKNYSHKLNNRVNNESKITIIGPATGLKNLNIDLGIGAIEIDNITLPKLDFKSSMADIEIKNSNISKSHIKFSMSDMDIENTKLANMVLESSMGNIAGENITFSGKNSIHSSMGNVDLKINDPENLLSIVKGSASEAENQLTVNSSMSSISISKQNQGNVFDYEDQDYDNRYNNYDEYNDYYEDYGDNFENKIEHHLENIYNRKYEHHYENFENNFEYL